MIIGKKAEKQFRLTRRFIFRLYPAISRCITILVVFYIGINNLISWFGKTQW